MVSICGVHPAGVNQKVSISWQRLRSSLVLRFLRFEGNLASVGKG